MRSKPRIFLVFLSLAILSAGFVNGQSCVPTSINKTVIDVACPQTCANLTFQIPHVKTSTDYLVSGIPYTPYPYQGVGGVELTDLYDDDLFSNVINLPFDFCFYGATYNRAVIGSNGLLTFDVTNAGLRNSWSLTTVPNGVIPQPMPYAGGSQNDIGDTYYPKAAIMGVYHDIYPLLPGPGPRRIEYSIVGTYPCRKFVASFYNVPQYSSPCHSLLSNTQIVLHESTGIIEVFIGNKPVCIDWNEGLAILGVQNWNRDRAVTAPGKNSTVWNEQDTGYRFLPSGGASKFVRSELLTMTGSLVMLADTITTSVGLLDLRFPNVCVPLGSTDFKVRTVFVACDNPGTELVSIDTITLTRTNELNATAVTVNTDCGPPNGKIIVTTPPGRGTAPFTYILDGGTPVIGGNPFTLNNVSMGPHTVVVTDASGSCTSTIDVTVARNNSLTALTSFTATACATVSTGTITVTATNGTGPYLFKLDGFPATPGSNPFTFTNVNSGLHDIVVFDVTGCQTNVLSVNVPIGPGADGTPTSVPSSCASVANGSITITATSGVAPFSWQLDGGTVQSGASPFTFNNVLAGAHTVRITDNLGCSRDINVTVNAGVGVSGTTSTVPTSCQSVSNGQIVATATGGMAPYRYQLDGGPQQTGSNPYTFTGVSAGTHTVVITDNVGCSQSFNVTVGFGPGLTATAVTGATSCNGAANGTITITSANGTGPYLFSLDGGTPVTGNIPYTFNNVSAGVHNVVVTDAPGCVTGPINVMVQPGPGLTTTVSKTDVACNGSATGSITIIQPVLGAPPYQYSLDGIVWQSGNSFSGLLAGNYTAYYRSSNGCQGSQPVTITQPTAVVATVAAVPVICYGENNGTINASATGGVGPYLFSINGGTSWQASGTFIVPAGNYTVSIRDANGCIQNRNLAVTQPNLLTAASLNNNASCDGGNDGRITVNANGGNAGYAYSIDGINFQTSNLFLVAPGTYNITVKDALGCRTSFVTSVGLSVNLFLTPQVDQAICEGNSTQLDVVSNATIYSWSPATGLSNTHVSNPVANPNITTQYIVTATLGRCTMYDTVIVNVNAAPIPDAGPPGDICYGQSYTLQGSGGVQYLWSPAIYLDNPSSPNALATPTKTTTYSLSVIDAIGCRSLITDNVTVEVSRPMRIYTYPFDTVAHPGARFPLLATSEKGISYSWTPATGLNNPDIANPIVTVGNIGDEIMYKVVGVSAEGCKGEGYVKIKVYKGPEIYVPTGFTPNNDGKNDKFTPFPVGIKSYNYFRVFNRWGQLIFSTSKLNDGWDGKLGGKEQPAGVYVWMIEGISSDNKVITKKGTVTLIR